MQTNEGTGKATYEVVVTGDEIREGGGGRTYVIEEGIGYLVARSGGGTLPVYEIPSRAVRVRGMEPGRLSDFLRSTDTPVIGRVIDGALTLDARTLLPQDEERIHRAFAGMELEIGEQS